LSKGELITAVVFLLALGIFLPFWGGPLAAVGIILKALLPSSHMLIQLGGVIVAVCFVVGFFSLLIFDMISDLRETIAKRRSS